MTGIFEDRQFEEHNEIDFPYTHDNIVYMLNWIEGEMDADRFSIRRFIAATVIDPESTDKTIPLIGARISRTRLSAWCKKLDEVANKRMITEGLFHDMVHALKAEFNFLSARQHRAIHDVGPDHMYHSIAARLDMWNNTVREMTQSLPGLFISYRPSVLWPGAVVRGVVSFCTTRNEVFSGLPRTINSMAAKTESSITKHFAATSGAASINTFGLTRVSARRCFATQ